MRNQPASLIFLAGTFALLLAGCRDETIQQYTLPKENASSPKPAVRLIAAIVPRQDQTWFIKLVGPEKTTSEHRQAFDDFLKTVRFTTDKDKPLNFDAPVVWRKSSEQKPGTVRRYATFHIGAVDQEAELTIIPLGREAGSLRDNVDRWRGLDLGLRPLIDDFELRKLCSQREIGGEPATIVEMRGPGVQKKAG